MIAAPYVKLSANVGRIVLFACLFFACLLGAIHVLTPPNPDSAIFDYMAWRVLSGDRLYVDVLEQNWPGAVWIHMVSSVTFGNTWWSFRLFDYLLMLQASVALFWMGRQSGLRWTGWIAAALYPVMYLTSSPWMTGQRDAMAAHILISSAVLYLNLRGQWRGQGMFVFGLLCALSVMIRPTYLLFPVLIVILDAAVHLWASRPLRPFFRNLGYAVMAFITFIAIVAAQGARTGGLTGWWESAILYNLMVYSGSADFATYLKVLVELFKAWHWYIVFGTIGSLLWLRAGDRWIWSMVMALAFTCLVSFVVQGKGFGYHLSGLLPVLALFAAHLIAWAVETVRARIHLLGLVIAVLLLTVALAGTALKLRSVTSNLQVLLGAQSLAAHLQRSKFVFDGMSMNDLLQVSNHIRAQTTTDETLLVWNRGVWINFLAERKMPVPFATVGALAEFKDPTLDMANVDHPVSLYAASKKANELMAHSYSHLFDLPTTGLRYFTVYGPWGRPDMAPWLFTSAILEGRPIDVFNQGRMRRDFTYIDDIAEGTVRALDYVPQRTPRPATGNLQPGSSDAPYRVYNIGNHQPVELLDFIATLERALGREAVKNFKPMQPGDVEATYADTEALRRDVGFEPTTPLDEGLSSWAKWYLDHSSGTG